MRSSSNCKVVFSVLPYSFRSSGNKHYIEECNRQMVGGVICMCKHTKVTAVLCTQPLCVPPSASHTGVHTHTHTHIQWHTHTHSKGLCPIELCTQDDIGPSHCCMKGHLKLTLVQIRSALFTKGHPRAIPMVTIVM